MEKAKASLAIDVKKLEDIVSAAAQKEQRFVAELEALQAELLGVKDEVRLSEKQSKDLEARRAEAAKKVRVC